MRSRILYTMLRERMLPEHRVEDPPLHRLQPVAHIGKCAAGDDRQRVVEVARLGSLVQRDRLLAVA